MRWWHHVQKAVIINQLIGAAIVLILLWLGYVLYALIVLTEMMIAYAIWWKVVAKK